MEGISGRRPEVFFCETWGRSWILTSALLGQMEVLIGEGVGLAALDEVVGEGGGLVAGIAGLGEGVEGGGKGGGVLGGDGFFELGEGRVDEGRGDFGEGDGGALVCGMVVEDVGEAFADFFEFVGGEGPVLGGAGEPEFGVAHLDEGHDLAEAGGVGLGLGLVAGGEKEQKG